MDNYQIARDRAQAYFLTFDQTRIIRSWDLEHDDGFVYVEFIGEKYAVCRKTGRIIRCSDGTQAGFSEVLSIFDFLCHEGNDKYLTGKFAPVNSLDHVPKTGGVDKDFYGKFARRFDGDPEGLRRACQSLGGTPVGMGDIGCEIPVFGNMKVILKFYHSDEDFPAGITFLWDSNTLSFIFYETVFYIMGFLLEQLEKCMDERKES